MVFCFNVFKWLLNNKDKYTRIVHQTELFFLVFFYETGEFATLEN